MKKFNFFEKLWEHSRTLRRVGLVLVMCLIVIPQMWAWTAIYFHGDFTGEWDGANYQINYELEESNSGHYFYPFYNGSTGNKFWRLYAQKSYVNYQLSPSTNNYLQNVGTVGYKVTSYKDWKNYNFKTTNATKGVLAVHINQGDANGDLTPGVWLEKPTIYIWHNWSGTTSNWGNNGGSGQKAMTNNNDGTYSYDGVYSASGTNVGIEGSGAIKKYFADNNTDICTKVGSPSSGDSCRFIWNAEGYKGYDDENHNTGSLTITKLVKITYKANSPTSGTAPSTQYVPYSSNATLERNDGNLALSGYVFTGWNTASNGKGTHYDVGATVENVTAGMTLYAEWTDAAWGIKGGEGDKDEGAGADHDALGNWITFNQLKKEGATAIYSKKIYLPARHTYCFKVFKYADAGVYYGFGSSGWQITFIGQTTEYKIYTGTQENMRLMTAGAGYYEFVWDSENEKVKVIFPEVNHPSMDYVYYTNPNGWGSAVTHLWGGASSTGWENLPSVSSFGSTYYYTPVGNSTDGLFANGDAHGQQSGNFTTSGHYGQSFAGGDSWSAFSVTINLDNQGADDGKEGTESRTVNLGYEVLTSSNISTPTKTGYNFGGYYTETGGNGLQIINANGAWQTSKTGYTDASGNWIKDGLENTLYAKWTEKEWDVTAVASPSSGGLATPNTTTSYGQITGGAIKASKYAGYDFSKWEVASGSGTITSTTTASTTFKPTADATVKAIFSPQAASGKLLYKFVVNTGVGEGNVCAADNTDYPQTVENSKLSTLEGGTLTARGSGTKSHLKYNNNAFEFNGANFYLKVTTDSPLKTGDVIRFINRGAANSDVAVRLTENNATNQILLPGNNNSVVQTVVVTSAFNNQSTFYIDRRSNTSYIESIEIIRPYVLTLNANTNGGTVHGNNTENMYFAAGETQTLPHANKSSNRFKGWYTTYDGSTEVDNPYTATSSGSTIYAQFETCASIASGTIYKFEVNTELTNAATGLKGDFDINKGNYLKTLVGGTLTGYDYDGTKMSVVSQSALKLIEKSKARLQADLDCAIMAGDTIITTTTGTGGYFISLGSGGQSEQAITSGTNQKVVVPASLVGKQTLFIRISSNNDNSISYFEIKRPAKYTVTHDLSGVTKSAGETTVIYKANYTATYAAADGYTLPSSVTVTRGETDITANCTWTQATGALSIPGAQMIGDITISITGDEEAPSCTTSPTVEAASNSSVAVTTATVTCSLGISSLGSAGCEISDYGFVVGTSTGPVIDGSGVTKHQVGTTDYTSTGTSFYKDLTGLTAGTTYYVRPYAINGNGTAYGTQTYFTTHYAITTGSHTNGSVTIPSSAAPSASVAISATPSTGYHFTSWDVYQTGSSSTKVDLDEDDDEDGKTRSFTMPSYAVTVDATFTINSWTLSWNFDGGSSSETAGTDYTSGSTNYGVTIDYPGDKTMSKEGYTFTGWDSSAETMPDNDLKITALWSANTYDVASHTLSNATLSSGGATGTNKATYGTNYTATFAANTGYNLPSDVMVQIGGVTKTKDTHYTWNSTTGELSINGSAILGNIAITVAGVAKTYTLTLKENGGTGGDGSATITWNDRGVSYSSQPSAPNESFRLDGYYTAATGGTKIISGSIDGGSEYIVGEYVEGWTTNDSYYKWAHDGNATLYAYWRRSINLNANWDYHGTYLNYGSVTVMLNGAPISYTTATGESGYTLQGYYTDKLGGTKVFNADGTYADDDVDGYIEDGKWVYTTEGTLSFYAHWAKEYTVTYDDNSATSGTAPAAQTNKAYGTTVTVASNSGSLAKTGYSFVGWNTANDGNGTFYAVGSTFTVTGDITLYAQWEDCSGSAETLASGTANAGQTGMDVTVGTITTNSLADKQDSYLKLNTSGYFEVTAKTGSAPIVEGDKLIVTMYNTKGSTQEDGFKLKSKEAVTTHTVSIAAESTGDVEYTLTEDDIEAGGTIKIFRTDADDRFVAIIVERSSGGGSCTTYNVSFANMTGFAGETTLPSTITGVYGGSTIAEPVSPKADGYAFAGWYKEGACSNKWDFSTDVVSSAKTLYAKWIDIDDTYTFHMGDGDIDNDSWKVATFTPTGYANYHAITNFEIPNQTRYPSLYVGYQGEFVVEAPSSGYSYMCEWDDYIDMTSYYSGKIRIQGNASPISDGDTKTAEGAMGTLQMSSTTHSRNWGLTFIPKGFGLTIAYTEEETAKTRIIPFHQTDNENIWETESFTEEKSNTLTSNQVAGTFKVGLATKTENVYVDCYQSAAEAASTINGRKLDAAYGGANIAAGASGRFQIIMSTNSSTSNFGLRWVPLENHTKQYGSWDGMGSATTLANKWSLGHAPTIDETVYIEHNTTITNDAQANSIRINKESEYMDLTIASTGSLLVTNDIQAKMADEDEGDYRATTAKDLRIETNYSSNGALITGAKSTTTQASYRFCTKAYKAGGYGYINQFVGIPFTEMSAYQLYGCLLYQYNAQQNKWLTCSTTMVADSAYNILRRGTDGRAEFLIDGTLILPGIEEGDKEKVLTCNGGRSALASSWKGEHLFANSWAAPIEVGAMTEGDFSNVDPTIYIFNAGSVKGVTDTTGYGRELGDNPGQWTALPVNDVRAHPENYSYKVIPAAQAFSVRATAVNGTVTLDYYKHVYKPIMDNRGVVDHTSLRAPKQNTNPSARLWMVVAGESLYKDETQIHERADFSTGHDAGWDGYKIFGNAHSPQLYTMSENSQLSVNAIPDMEGTVVGFRKGSDDDIYTFSFKYNGDDTWYLNDLKEQTSTLISNENTYMFSSESEDAEARFIISASPIAPVITGVEQTSSKQDAKARKVMINDHIYIIRGGRMYSIDGAVVK